MQILKYHVLGGKRNKRLDSLIDIITNKYRTNPDAQHSRILTPPCRLLPFYELRLKAMQSKRSSWRKPYEDLTRIIEKSHRILEHVTVVDQLRGHATCKSTSKPHKQHTVRLGEFFCSCRKCDAGFICSHMRAAAMALGGLER